MRARGAGGGRAGRGAHGAQYTARRGAEAMDSPHRHHTLAGAPMGGLSRRPRPAVSGSTKIR